MIQLHYLNHSRAHRIAWLLEELEFAYEVVMHTRNVESSLAPDSLKFIHPLGKSPVIEDGDKNVAESGAIVEYLIHKAGNTLKPAVNTPEHAHYTYWMHFAEGSAMPLHVINLIFDKIENADLPWYLKWLVRPIAQGISQQVKNSYLEPNLNAQLEFIDNHLKQNTWFCGSQLTGADIMMSFPLEIAIHNGKTKPNRTPNNILRYVSQIHQRPCYQRALAKCQNDYAFYKP